MRNRNKKLNRVGKKIPVIVKKGSKDVLGRLTLLCYKQPHAVLATLSSNEPYTSLVAYAITPDLKGLIFTTPRGTQKYKNILRNKKVSLLIDTRSDTAGDYMKTESLSISGLAITVRAGKLRNGLAHILNKKHPRLKRFVNAPSTALILVKINKCIHVSSFQVVSQWP